MVEAELKFNLTKWSFFKNQIDKMADQQHEWLLTNHKLQAFIPIWASSYVYLLWLSEKLN